MGGYEAFFCMTSDPWQLWSDLWTLDLWPLTSDPFIPASSTDLSPLDFWHRPLTPDLWPIDLWPLTSGPWHLATDLWPLALTSCPWPLALELWPLTPDLWHLTSGPWPLTHWPLTPDLWPTDLSIFWRNLASRTRRVSLRISTEVKFSYKHNTHYVND